MAHKKIHIFAEEAALIHLMDNKDFSNGYVLKFILRNLADIWVIKDEDEFESDWGNAESSIRKFCEAYDIAKPRANSALKLIYSNPALCLNIDPFGIWLFNKSEAELSRFKEYLGVWAISVSQINEQYFNIEHSKEYDKNDIIEGPKDNGWGNYFAEMSKPLPPLNSIVLNDRYLVFRTNEGNANEIGFWGLNNLKVLLNELLPQNLRVPFHLFIFCQHPELSINETDEIVDYFINDVKGLREYPIEIEFVYDISRHKRGIYSNYFFFDIDRAINAFYDSNPKKLNGENDFKIQAYLSNPFASGENYYDTARSKIKKIQNQSLEAMANSNIRTEAYHEVVRVQTSGENRFINRLFL